MLNENHQNLSCKFAGEIVPYLYDEIKGKEKLRFETHLKSCSSCLGEVGGFTAVRASITDWRETEFSPLENPRIEINYEQNHQRIENSDASRPWFERIRELFSLSPVWMTAAASIAVLTLCFGAGFLAINFLSRGGEKIIVQQDKPISVTTPIREIGNQNSKDSNSIEAKAGQFPAKVVANNNPVVNKGTPERVTDNQLPKAQGPNGKRTVPPTVNNSIKAPTKFNKREKVPSLAGEEEEDDSLRLSDIFDEIGSR